MLRGLRAILDADSALTLRAGVNRGPVLRRRHRRERPPRLRRDGRHRQPRRAPGRTRRAGRDPRHGRGARALPHAVRNHGATVPRQGQGARDHGLQRGLGDRCRRGGSGQAAADRRPRAELAELRAAVDAARMRQSQIAELVGEPGIGKSRLVEELKTLAVGFTHLTTRCDQYAVSVPYFPLRSLLRRSPGSPRPRAQRRPARA